MTIRSASFILALTVTGAAGWLDLLGAEIRAADENGTIQGEVTYGGPVPNVTVTLLQGDAKKATKTTDANGKFTFKDIAFGDYTLEASGVVKNKRRQGTASASITETMKTQTVTIKLEL